MNVEFRRATIDDVKGIIELCDECFDETNDLDYALECFRKTENDPNQIYIVGIVDNKFIAHSKITIIPTMYSEMGTYAILNHVCVKKEYRRHKIATLMLDDITALCKDMGCDSIKLWSRNIREAAHACYNKYNFDKIDAGFFEKNI